MNDHSPKRHDKFRAYRARKKAAGYREQRRWVWDVHSSTFKARLRREAEILTEAPEQKDASDFIDAIFADTMKDTD